MTTWEKCVRDLQKIVGDPSWFIETWGKDEYFKKLRELVDCAEKNCP